MNKIDWCIDQHEKTNHFYDNYIPYRFHLGMANLVYEQYNLLLDDKQHYWGDDTLLYGEEPETLSEVCSIAVWGHDLLEDTRVSFNDVKQHLGDAVAEVIYAVTNEKGKNRKERANNKYYKGIRETPGAVFIKLCDRIANVRYAKMMQSRQFNMYKEENEEFIKQLGYELNHPLEIMFEELINLFK